MGNETKQHLRDRIALRKAEKESMGQDLIVVARNPAEMQVAQNKLINWASVKMLDVQAELDEAEENLGHAIKSKWRQTGFKKVIKLAEERLNYYTKVHAALEMGYVIVPNFDLDIFAIRTTKTSPEYESSTRRWGKPHPMEFENKSDRPQLGDGEYQNPWPEVTHSKITVKDHAGKDEQTNYCETGGWRPVDFPFKLVKPQILTDTAKALQAHIFDEVGVTPHRQVRNQDPMVIGQIIFKKSAATERRISFLLTWWVDESDLEV